MMYATQMYNRYKHTECFGSWYIKLQEHTQAEQQSRTEKAFRGNYS